MSKLVYSFSEGSKQMSKLLGNKGANLAEMTKLGLPVPFGFTIATEAYREYAKENKISEELIEQLRAKMIELEEVTLKKFGDVANPLLISIRSSSVVKVPGIIDSVMNLGLNDDSVIGLTNITGSERFAFDRYRQFIQEFGQKVFGLSRQQFNNIYEETEKIAKEEEREITVDEIRDIILDYKEYIKSETGVEFPQEIRKQIAFTIKAFYESWNSEIATHYRERNSIRNSIGIAINLQSMVFGNTGEGSCTGVAYTRNPVKGYHHIFGDFRVNSLGGNGPEASALQPIIKMQEILPKEYENLKKISGILEMHYKDVQEMEFTVENHKLYMLQTKEAKRTTDAAIKIAVDMVNEKLISREEALMRLEPMQIEQLMEQYFDQEKLWEGKLAIKEEIANSPLELEYEDSEEKIDFIEYYRTIMRWCDDIKKMEVRCSADNQMEALEATALGAEGIGLCRTESIVGDNHEESSVETILKETTVEELNETLKKIYPTEKENFKSIYEIMGERHVAIRILDLPTRTEDSAFNRRGCRLAIAYPQIVEMQTKAIINAAIEVNREQDINITPEIMIPFVTIKEELIIIREMINKAAKEAIKEADVELRFNIGTMIDTPRAALIADKLAEYSDFFVFGTNDLTNMTFGLMDSQIEEVIKQYQEENILSNNPLQSLDINGVGRLVKMVSELGRGTKKNMKLGICGRHTGDSKTVEFCNDIPLDYISCDPKKIPAVKISAAQAVINKSNS